MTKLELLKRLRGITYDLARAECPCAKCMGGGCVVCDGNGCDLESLKKIRGAFADALIAVKRLQGRTIAQLARELVEL